MEKREKLIGIKSNFTGNDIEFSVIIPFKEYNNYLFETLTSLNEQTYKDFEIILLPDNPGNDKPKDVIEIPTGHLKPADKRDIGAKNAKGEPLAFIDDDAYPNEIWLEKSLEYFKDPDIAMVCGPGFTPQNDSPRQVASGKIYESFIVSGKFMYRYNLSKARFVDDFPSCNFLIRKSIFKEAGGFPTQFWPSEDTKLIGEDVPVNGFDQMGHFERARGNHLRGAKKDEKGINYRHYWTGWIISS